MIPIKLTLEGIYSYQISQTIDFTKLTKEKLFGIFGVTGSGKSTILEAMLLTLYNYSERIGKKSFKYDMMNLKSNKLWIDFEFIAGKDSNHYRSTYEMIRNKKKFNDITKTNNKLYKKENNNWISIHLNNNTIENIIGLNYDNFRRIVIIPQGRFQEFLQLEGAKKAVMMMDIFPDLKKYNLSDKIKKLKIDTINEVTNLEGQLTQLKDANKELLKEKIKERKNISENLLNLQKKVDVINTEIISLKDIKTKIENKNLLQQKLNTLQQQKEKINENEIEIKEYQECIRLFKANISLKESIEKTISDKNNELNKKIVSIENNKQIAETISSQIKDITDEYNKKDINNHEITSLKKIISIKKDTEILKYENECINQLNERINKGNSYINKILNEKKILQESLKDENAYISMSKELLDIKDWFSINNKYLLEKQQLITQLSDVNKELNELKTNYLDLIQKSSFLQINENDNIEIIKNKINKTQNNIKAELNKVRQEIQSLKIKENLNNYSINMEEGQPCPLCGSTHHPQLIKIENVEKNIKSQQQKETELQDNFNCCNTLIINLNNLSENINKYSSKEIDIKDNIKIKEEQIKNHIQQFKFDGFSADNEQYINNKAKEITSKIRDFENIKKALQTNDTKLENSNKLLEELKNQLNSHNNNLYAIKSKIETQKNDIPPEYVEKYLQKTDNEINEQIEILTQKNIDTEKQYQYLIQKNEKLQQEINSEIGTIEAYKNDIIKNKKQLEQILNEIQNSLNKTTYISIDHINNIINKDLDISAIQKEIDNFKKEEISIQSQLLNITQQLEGKSFDSDKYQQKLSEQEDLQFNLNNLQNNIGACEEIISRLNKQILEKEKLNKEYSTKSERLSNLELLNKLFEGNKFVKYVSKIYLEDLCRNANDRFRKMTANQLELTINDDSEFELIDVMNDGKRRSVKTLSGGQTFQASLSLALALVDNIRKSSLSEQKFFFIDEGFGSQDKNSLNIIFETLKSLRNEDRIVGIISHVEELQEKIPANIIVSCDEDGSKISIHNT